MRVFTTVELILMGLGTIAALTCFVWAYIEHRKLKLIEQTLREVVDMLDLR